MTDYSVINLNVYYCTVLQRTINDDDDDIAVELVISTLLSFSLIDYSFV